jgi:hypothetical protein
VAGKDESPLLRVSLRVGLARILGLVCGQIDTTALFQTTAVMAVSVLHQTHVGATRAVSRSTAWGPGINDETTNVSKKYETRVMMQNDREMAQKQLQNQNVHKKLT